jgi:hypothetical protein
MPYKTESEFRKAQARAARGTLIRLKHRLAANEELWATEVEFEEKLDEAIQSGNAKMLDAAEVLRRVDEQS